MEENLVTVTELSDTSKRWYVVHAYSGFEKSVQRALEDRIARAGCLVVHRRHCSCSNAHKDESMGEIARWTETSLGNKRWLQPPRKLTGQVHAD